MMLCVYHHRVDYQCFIFFSKAIEAKEQELKETKNSCAVVRHNVDKLNKELASKMEDLEKKESLLKDVETRTQLSLRFDLNLSIKQIAWWYTR